MRRMKDSGVEWIGEIPEEWEVLPLKSFSTFGKGLPITKANLIDDGVAVISYGQVHSKNNSGHSICDDLLRYVSDGYLRSNPDSMVNPGEFIFADTSEDYEGIGNCAYVDTDGKLFAGYHTIIIRPHDFEGSKYLAFLFMTDAWRSQLRAQASGIKVYSITLRMLKSVTVIAPPPDTRMRIAAYLDRKCAQIDSILSLQQAAIEKLKEYKLSLITEAVTKGLNPDAPMKDSGIEWIGEVPAHWKNIRLLYLIDFIESGVSVNAGQEEAAENEYGVLKTSSVSKFVFDVHENKSVNYDDMNRVSCPVKEDTIIVSRMNTPELVGACGYVDRSYDNIFLPDRLWQVHFLDGVYVKFIYYYLRSKTIRNYYSSLSTGTSSSMQNISQGQFTHAVVSIPPFEEQKGIVSFLDKKCENIDQTIENKQQLISRLTAYKKSLIYEVVTGKKEA